jgi:molybdopterin synthase catalytic subunit
MIRVQREVFDAAAELRSFSAAAPGVGATAMFVGSVRGENDGKTISAMTLEHYPGMTERALADIEAEALARWPIERLLIIHRYGRLEPSDDIVLVITSSAHRHAAFAACEFLMDWLKTKAPFWKFEEGETGSDWVEAKTSDDEAAARWNMRER